MAAYSGVARARGHQRDRLRRQHGGGADDRRANLRDHPRPARPEAERERQGQSEPDACPKNPGA